MLFIGTSFYEKGAVEAVAAVGRARATHDVHLDLVSYVPDEWAAPLRENGAVTVHAPGGADMVQRLYEQADVLLFPSHMDTFGWVVLEAMAQGLPVLAPRHLALEETVRHDVTGLLFAPENMLYGADARSRFNHILPPPREYLRELRTPSDSYVDGVAATLALLCEDEDRRARLAAGALEEIRSGRFSIGRRREQLGRIYAEAAG